MTTRPTVSPLFATDATLGTGTESALVPRLDPGAGVRARGLLANTRVPGRWINWLIGVAGDWLAYLTQKTDHVFFVDQYGAATANTAAVNTPLIQAAIDACSSAGGGTVRFGIGTYRHTGLVWKTGVRLEGVPGKTVLSLDHATNHFITFSSSSSGEMVVYGIDFEGTQTNNGDVIHNVSPQAASITLQHCWINVIDSLLTGQLIFSSMAGSQFTLVDCLAYSFRAGIAIQTGGLVVIRGGMYTMLAAATNHMISALALDVKGARFYQVKTGSTAAAFLDLQSPTDPASYLRAHGNHFDVDDSSAGAGGYAIKLAAGAYMEVGGNTFGHNCVRYLATSSLTLRAQSRLDLVPAIAADEGTSPTIAVPAGYDSVLLKSIATAGPALTMPEGWFAGQELDLTYYNASASSVAPSFATTPVTGTTIPTIGAGNTMTGRFVWEDRNVGGAPSRWIQKGTWGVGVTLA